MTSDWIEQTEQDAAKASGGGGIIAQCEIHRGYKVFVKGLSNTDSFFSYVPNDENGKKKALGLAQSKGGKPQDSIELTVYKNSVKGREVTWTDNRVFTYPLWTDAFKKVFLPSVKETHPPLGVKFWGKVSFKEDPSGRTKPDQNGEVKPELVAFIAQVYMSEQEAIADAGSGSASNGSNGSTQPSDPMIPSDYSPSDWMSLKGDLQKAITEAESTARTPIQKKKARAEVIEKLSAEYLATAEQVEHLVNS